MVPYEKSHARKGSRMKFLDIPVRIVNVVATAALDHSVDLESLPDLFPHTVTYNPELYPPPTPAYFKSGDMQGKVSIFSTGKMISVGTRSEDEAKKELILVSTMLKKKGIAKLKIDPKVQNMVAVADIGFKLDIEKINRSMKAIYEPEQFPAAIIHFRPPMEPVKATFLLFSSGKIVCVGLKNLKDLYEAIQYLLNKIDKLNM